MDDTKDEPIITPKKADNGFIKHVFNMDNDTKHNILNTGQYLALAAIPLALLFNFIDTVIPKVDESKGNAELIIEIFGQVSLLLFSIYLVDKIITYIPSYSGKEYDGIVDRQYRMTIIGIAILLLVPKIAEKFKIIFHRIKTSWDGEPPNQEKQQKKSPKVRVTQPITGMTQPVPTQQPIAQPDYQSQHNMMAPPQQPVMNTGGVQQQQQQMNVANNGMMMMQEPMAANDGFGAFSSF
jgi:hypothetical protein